MSIWLHRQEKYIAESMVPYNKTAQTLTQDDYDDLAMQNWHLMAYDIIPTGRNKAVWMRDARHIANTFIEKMVKIK